MATYKHKVLLPIQFAMEKAEKNAQEHSNYVIKIKAKKSNVFTHIYLPHHVVGPFFQCQLPN